MITLAKEGLNLTQIAARLRIPYQTAVTYKTRLNLTIERIKKVKETKRGRTENKELIEGIKTLAAQGLTRSHIANRLGTSYALVVYYEKNLNIPIIRAYKDKFDS
jgi:hypothetical protein